MGQIGSRSSRAGSPSRTPRLLKRLVQEHDGEFVARDAGVHPRRFRLRLLPATLRTSSTSATRATPLPKDQQACGRSRKTAARRGSNPAPRGITALPAPWPARSTASRRRAETGAECHLHTPPRPSRTTTEVVRSRDISGAGRRMPSRGVTAEVGVSVGATAARPRSPCRRTPRSVGSSSGRVIR